jgi:putative ABC transport system permease protein
MAWLDGVAYRIRTLFNSAAHERELRDEMQFHVDLDAVQQGDHDAARRRFGNRTWYQEETRRLTWLGSLDVLRQDAGYAWRSIRRSPAFTITILVTLSLGIGLNAASFTLLDQIYLRAPAAVENPFGLRRLWFQMSPTRMADRKTHTAATLYHPIVRAIAATTDNPRALAAYRQTTFSLGEGSDARRVHTIMASADYFPILGVRPALGRFYSRMEDSLGNGSPVAVVSHRFWRTALGGDSTFIGKALDLSGTRYTVVGIASPSFTGLEMQAADVWIPLSSPPARLWSMKGRWWDSTIVTFRVVMRPSPTMSDREFEERATAAAREADRALFPRPDPGMRVLTGSIIEARGPGDPRQNNVIGTRLFGVAVIVLLIACANVVNLLLARAVRRRREIAVRLALGISRARLIRLLTTETLLIAIIAGGAAVLAAWWGGTLFRSLLFGNIEWHESVLHWRVLVFAIGVALLAGLVSGIVPAIQSSNPKLSRALKDGANEAATKRPVLRDMLVVVQAALSVTLLVGAVLFVRSLNNVQAIDLGYDADRLLFASVLYRPGQRAPGPVVAASMKEIAERLSSRPGIEGVARASSAPMMTMSFTDFFWGPAGANSSRSLRGSPPNWSGVSPNYFQTVGLHVTSGSGFDGNTPQVIVNEEMAGTLWPPGQAIGQCMRFGQPTNPCYTVVGVVENASQRVLERRPWPQFYLPVDQLPDSGSEGTTLIVRAREDAVRAATAELSTTLRAAFPGAEPMVNAMTQNLEAEYRPWRLGAILFSAFGLLALLVAVVGIYSTVSYDVTQRTSEFGVRVALGAQLGDVLGLVVRETVRVVAGGILIGLTLAIAGGKLVERLLYGIEPYDPKSMLLVTVTLLVVAGLAAMLPAWRAARVDPVTALRSE